MIQLLSETLLLLFRRGSICDIVCAFVGEISSNSNEQQSASVPVLPDVKFLIHAHFITRPRAKKSFRYAF